MDSKKCVKCSEVKPIEEYYLNCYGRNGACKKCVAAKNKAYYQQKAGAISAKHAENRAAKVVPDVGALARRQAMPITQRYGDRQDKVKARRSERYQDDPKFRLAVNDDTSLRRAINTGGDLLAKKVGCTEEWFWEWIEYQMAEGMSHDNYGKVWNLDHVIPKSAFDLSDPDQVVRCHHWTNLRPVSVSENSSKHSKRDGVLEFQHSMLSYIFQLIQDNWLLRGNNA